MKTDEERRDFPKRPTISKNLLSKATKYKNESNEPVWKCRYVIVLVGFFVFFYLNYIRLNMSVSIVAMVNNSAISQQVEAKSVSCPNPILDSIEEDIRSKMEGEFNWSEKIQFFILGSYYFGYVATQMPTGLLAERYGCKWFLFGSSLVTGVCALLIPSFSSLSASAVMFLQLLRGLAQGIIQPATTILAANWFPKTERGFLNALINSGSSPGSCLGSIFSGYICDSAGRWPASLYATGAAGIVLALSILYFIAESPKVHPKISKAELHFILRNQETDVLRRRPKLPWNKILKSAPVYALAYAYFGQVWAMTQFSTVHSTFLSAILHYSIEENGLFSAAPFFVQFLCSQSAAWISLYMQKKKIARIDFIRKFWNTSACLGISMCLLGMYLAGCNRSLSVTFAILSTGCTGFGFASCWVVAPDMTPKFAGSIHGICCTIGFFASCLVPVVTGYLTDKRQTIEQWNKVFFISMGVVMSSGIVFALFGSAEIQPWNFAEEESLEKDDRQAKHIETVTENADKFEEQTRF